MTTTFTIPQSTRGALVLPSFHVPSPGNKAAWGSGEIGWSARQLYHYLPSAMDDEPVDLRVLDPSMRRRVVELLIERAMGGYALPEPGRRWMFRDNSNRFGEFGRLHKIATAVRPERGASLYVPPDSDDEYRQVQERSRQDYCSLLVKLITQNLQVEDYRVGVEGEDGETDAVLSDTSAKIWKSWKREKMPARHVGVNRTVATLGYSYVWVDQHKRTKKATYTPWSPLRTYAWYPQDWTDEDPSMTQSWPALVFRIDRPNRISVYDAFGGWTWRIVEESAIGLDGFGKIALVAETGYTEYAVKAEKGDEHAPLVRMVGRTDLIGDPVGEVEPGIPVQERLEETNFSVLMAQVYASFRQRWATGMSVPKNPDGTPRSIKLKPFQSLLTNESPDGQFGDFGVADLQGFVQVMEMHLRSGAATSQAPPQALLGSMDNVGADGLAAAEMGNQRASGEYKINLGEGYAQMLREGARMEGDDEGYRVVDDEIIWKDTEARSLQSLAQGLGVVATALGVPKRALWPMLPVSRTTIRQWEKMADEEEAKDPWKGAPVPPEGAPEPGSAPMMPENETAGGPGAERRTPAPAAT